MCSKYVKNVKFDAIMIRCVPLCSKYARSRFRLGLPSPHRNLLGKPPDPLVGWGGRHPLPIRSYPSPRRLRRLDLGAFRASVVNPQRKILDAYAFILRFIYKSFCIRCYLFAIHSCLLAGFRDRDNDGYRRETAESDLVATTRARPELRHYTGLHNSDAGAR